jgi:hypothetical protein
MDKETFKQAIDYLDESAMITDEKKAEFLKLFERNQELEVGKVYFFTGACCGNGMYGILTGFCGKQFVCDNDYFANAIGVVAKDSIGKIVGREF